MRPRILLTVCVIALFVILSGCGTATNCPTCGTTKNGAYTIINVVTVPEHNPTGEPGGPFNSFDISTIAPNPAASGHYLDYISDRIGLAMVVIDTGTDIAVDALQGSNAVTDAGNGASPCDPSIPPIATVFGNFTRFGCRNPPFHLNTGFGANGNFGGFPGAQCCASRANGVNPMSGPDGNTTTPDGKFLFVGNGSASFVTFDLTTMDLTTSPPTQPVVIADVPTGVSADYDGPLGIAPCVASWNGEAGSSADCGDDRGDEMAEGSVMGADGATHQVLAIINGDPGLPFITFFDVTHIVAKNPSDSLQLQHCLPIDSAYPYGPYPAGFTLAGYNAGDYPYQATSQTTVAPAPGASFNPPSCVIGQVYYDGAGGTASNGIGLNVPTPVPVDNVGNTFPCPDPSNPQTFGGVSGSAAASMVPGIGITPVSGTLYTIPCHHGPILNYSNGEFTTANQTVPCGTCAGAIAPAGLGGMAWNPVTGHLLLANENAIAVTNIGTVDEIDPQVANNTCGGPCGPVVVNSFVMPNCMPTGVTQGPGNYYLIGCADHDGEAFPPNEYIINDAPGNTIVCNTTAETSTNCVPIYNVGGVDETWYNPTDNKYYLAARDMPNGAVMGVIDAGSNQWLANMTTGSNAHSIAVDPNTNHVFVPLQAGTICTTQSANGCVGVATEQ
ncbi:MAG TPA: hypothetical protein VIH78_05790 [Terriglobales bacterium]